MNKYKQIMAFGLALVLSFALFTGAIGATSQHTGVLDGIFPNEHYAPQNGAKGADPADGMPEGQDDRFGEDASREDRAADGSNENNAGATTAENGVSVWVSVLVLSLVTAVIVCAVIYLLPSRKEKKE